MAHLRSRPQSGWRGPSEPGEYPMRLLLWTIAADEVAEKRDEPTGDVRKRLKAVD